MARSCFDGKRIHSDRYVGSMTGMFPPDYLRSLRDEWE